MRAIMPCLITVSPAKRLRDRHFRALRQIAGVPAGIKIAGVSRSIQLESAGNAYQLNFALRCFRRDHSALPSRAAFAACQDRIAHFWCWKFAFTPASTPNLPNSSDAGFASVIHHRDGNSWKIFSAWSFVFPLSASVIDAEVLEIAQPLHRPEN